MTTPFDRATYMEEQLGYQDSPEFDSINDLLSNKLLEINNLLNNLHRNLNYLDECIESNDNYGGKVEKFHKTASSLISKLVPLFKSLSGYTNKLNDLDVTLLNKSQRFVKDKLNSSVKKSLQQFNELQTTFTELDRRLNEINLQVIQDQERRQSSEDNRQQNSRQQQQLIIEYEPVNAEELEYHRNLVEEREREIENISNSVSEINEMFHDLSNLVLSQGEVIDNIETNIYSTVNDTRMASRHLVKADKYHRAQRKLCFWLLIILCVIVLFLILVILA